MRNRPPAHAPVTLAMRSQRATMRPCSRQRRISGRQVGAVYRSAGHRIEAPGCGALGLLEKAMSNKIHREDTKPTKKRKFCGPGSGLILTSFPRLSTAELVKRESILL
jgi:hypothetical protein